MPSTTSYQPGEIVLVDFPYTASGPGKPRPAPLFDPISHVDRATGLNRRATRNRPTRGTTRKWVHPAERRSVQPMPQRGRNNAAQGNALGKGIETNRSPERAGQFSKAAAALHAQFRSSQTAPSQRFAGNERVCGALSGLGRELTTGFPGRCPGLDCYSPFRAKSRCRGYRLVRMSNIR